MSDSSFPLLTLRNTLENALTELNHLDIIGSGQTTDGTLLADISFEYLGHKYKLWLRDCSGVPQTVLDQQERNSAIRRNTLLAREREAIIETAGV